LRAINHMLAKGSGTFVRETSMLAAAHAKGFSTAAVGKLGPVAMQDLGALDSPGTILIDDLTGLTVSDGAPMPADLQAEIARVLDRDPAAPSRGDNGRTGNCVTPGTVATNWAQQSWFLDVTTQVLLPRFKREGKPFALVYWSRDPDGSQHNHGDS